MSNPRFCQLEDRALVRIGGEAAQPFLQGLVTCNIDELETGEAEFGALLSPQGKILFDFFLLKDAEGFIADIDASMASDFIKRLMFYRLRAKVDIEALDDGTKVYAVFADGTVDPAPWSDAGLAVRDPRLPDMGVRAYLPSPPEGAVETPVEDYEMLRIRLGVPQGGRDFAYGDAFPHDVLMDRIAGVDFAKGCYVGQEVVSRMQHRGTARKRIILAQSVSGEELPQTGTEVLAGGKTVGALTSVAGNRGLAMVRLDRAAPSVTANETILAGSTAITLALQEWSKLEWPVADSGGETGTA
jgi:folate-binding protein YgfZ